MNYALFLGCNIPARLNQYERSSRAILNKMGINLVDIAEFNCCGYPLRNSNFGAFVLSAARNLALASSRHIEILTLCQCCFGSLKQAQNILKEQPELCQNINTRLAKEGIKYEEGVAVKHLLYVLYHEVGIETIETMISRPYRGLPIAIQYGCHSLRPSKVVNSEDPFIPEIFDSLIEVTGSKSIDWQTKLECCGAPVLGTNDKLSFDLLHKKIDDAKQAGASFLCSACPYCHLQFEIVQKMLKDYKKNEHLPPLLYPQLLGLSFGMEIETLGIEMNQEAINKLDGFYE